MENLDLYTNDIEEVDVKDIKLEPDLFGSSQYQKSKDSCARQRSEENRSSTGQSGTDQEQSPTDDANPCSTSPISSAPVCRQFWKAGNYNEGLPSKSMLQNRTSYLHIHPKFLHSNATSHKWAFGAIAELLDNAIDEIANDATFVNVDKTLNPRDGTTALLIQDDGGGMDPEAMRRCLSFGYSDKKSKSAIGQYGNGFKTSSMRLGADVIVFSRHMKGRVLTQSIGLLSYTFLTQTGHDRIVVPMVDYEFNESTRSFDILSQYSKEHFMSNLSMLLQWSPYSTEAELLKQMSRLMKAHKIIFLGDPVPKLLLRFYLFRSWAVIKATWWLKQDPCALLIFDDISHHGTKVIIYNLWLIDEGKMELDFESDAQDILIAGDNVERGGSRMQLSYQHLANRLRYSLRAYLSVLYLRIPETFCIVLRGCVVEYHNIANDLKFPEFILYKPQSCGSVEGKVITTIGFLKEAPHVDIHGFNVYHKNRLILPFWHVVNYSRSRGRGVVGVLEANFVEPTHNKQDFEKTPVFQKLEARLKEMTWEYWDYHCGLIGYYQVRKPRAPFTPQGSTDSRQHHGTLDPVLLSRSSKAVYNEKPAPAGAYVHNSAPNSIFLVRKPGQPMLNSQRNSHSMSHLKRKDHDLPAEPENVKRKAVIGVRASDTGLTHNMQPAATGNHLENLEAVNLRQENTKLHAQCLECEKKEEQLNLKVNRLRTELKQAQREYARLLVELRLLEKENIKGGIN